MKPIATIVFFIFSLCATAQNKANLPFDKHKADYLYHFAYECIDKEYPNKTSGVLGDDSYLLPPHEIHPAFYGCFDWHSSVHGHWTLVTILSQFPDFEYRDEIITKLKRNITSKHILKEVEYLNDVHNASFERTYGWAWLLKLDEALREWDDPEAMNLQKNLAPLTDTIAAKFSRFLDKLVYPIRIGEHSNIAFAMSFAYDWAQKYDTTLALKIKQKALEYYNSDCNCPLTWEPGGFDFLSPCLQEASVMLKIMNKDEFHEWLSKFMPGFEDNPDNFLKIAIVTDRSDGKLAHLDGLNFSRAWCLFEMGHALQNEKMIKLGIKHFNYSYDKMDSGEYAGAHWLASFAVYALIKSSISH